VRVRGLLLLATLALAGCPSLNVEQALPPPTPISTTIQRLDDPNQAYITYSAKEVIQRGPKVEERGKVPPDRIAWTLLGLEDRVTGERRHRLTLAMAYDDDQSAGLRNYDRALVLPGKEPLEVQPYSRRTINCGGFYRDMCYRQEVVFVWLQEPFLRNVGPGGLSLEVGGEHGRIWQFTVPRNLIDALFAAMDKRS